GRRERYNQIFRHGWYKVPFRRNCAALPGSAALPSPNSPQNPGCRWQWIPATRIAPEWIPIRGKIPVVSISCALNYRSVLNHKAQVPGVFPHFHPQQIYSSRQIFPLKFLIDVPVYREGAGTPHHLTHGVDQMNRQGAIFPEVSFESKAAI